MGEIIKGAEMATISSSDSTRVYEAIVIVDPETGLMGTQSGVKASNSVHIWNSDGTQVYQPFVIVDPNTGLPTSNWASSDIMTGPSTPAYNRLITQDGSTFITQQVWRIIV